MPIIKTINLTKKFKDLVAVNSVSLEITENECFGLLGPNGAGKTSFFRMLTGVSPPTQGYIEIVGKDLARHPSELKAILGVVPQMDNLDPDLDVLQNLLNFARYFDIPRKEAYRRSMEVLDLFQLQDKRKSKIEELSGGMRRRLLIARGLINRPRIMVLDEPSIGLDPQTRHLVWQKLKELKAEGVTQLLCTQNMDEASLLCDRVAIMHLGKILALDTPQKLVTTYVGSRIWEIELNSKDRDSVVRELASYQLEFDEVDNTIHVFHLEEKLDGKSLNVPCRPRTATLEDVFFKLTGRLLVE